MAVFQGRKDQQQLHGQPGRAIKGASSAFIHESGGAGAMKRSGVSNGCVNAIPAASPGAAVPCSDATLRSVCFYGLTYAFAPGRFFVDEPTYLTESQHKTKLELQAASTLCDHDIDVIQKTKHARFAQYPKPSGSYVHFQEIKRSATCEANAVVGNDDDDDDDDDAATRALRQRPAGPDRRRA
ncbi:uncharacterized protein LOC142572634 [Dermacentor variabilis]|uniref:uncharacterized protein LOC142572634 n=1 Tax=Dermacentor variabilis TaxID=34621 RepID=UPI003F5C4596